MNKKLIYIFVFLVLGLFVISACNLIKQEEVGRKVLQPKEKNGGGIEDFVTLDLRINPEGWGYISFVNPYDGYITINNRTVYRYPKVYPNGSLFYINDLRAGTRYYRNYTFDRWTGMIDDVRGFNATQRGINLIPMNRNRIITANFRRI